MASQMVDNAGKSTASKPHPAASTPSHLWCKWQALKGTNFLDLSTPVVDLQGNWIVLTGGNSGIGLEAALQFVKWGANIVLGCRQPPPQEIHPDIAVKLLKDAAIGAGHKSTVIEWWECDMNSLKSVENFGKRWIAKDQSLDILVNNAGTGGAPGGNVQYTEDGLELVHQVNFISHVLLTTILLPSLAQASRPRIICTTSCMQYFGIFDLSNSNSGRNAYPNNKLYFQIWLTELQTRMSKSAKYKHLIIHGVHPGYVKTNIWGSPKTLKNLSWLQWSLQVLLEYVGIDAQQGSLAITYAATGSGFTSQQDTPTLEGGKYFNRIWEETPMPQTKNPICRRQVWKFVNKELSLVGKGLLAELGI